MNNPSHQLVLFFIALLCSASTARAQWFDFQPGYYTKVDIGTARAEGGGKFAPPLSAYGFVDFYGQNTAKFDLNTYYGEARLMHSLGWVDPRWQTWNFTAEVNGGTDYAGILRLGVVWNTSLGAGNTFALKLYPVASRDRDAQASIYCSQMFTPKLSGFLVFDYGFGTWILGERQIYVELEARYRLTKKLSVFVQGRQFAGITGFKLDPTPVVGLKWSL
jgi:hypothetical protein